MRARVTSTESVARSCMIYPLSCKISFAIRAKRHANLRIRRRSDLGLVDDVDFLFSHGLFLWRRR